MTLRYRCGCEGLFDDGNRNSCKGISFSSEKPQDLFCKGCYFACTIHSRKKAFLKGINSARRHGLNTKRVYDGPQPWPHMDRVAHGIIRSGKKTQRVEVTPYRIHFTNAGTFKIRFNGRGFQLTGRFNKTKIGRSRKEYGTIIRSSHAARRCDNER